MTFTVANTSTAVPVQPTATPVGMNFKLFLFKACISYALFLFMFVSLVCIVSFQCMCIKMQVSSKDS